MLSDAVAAFLDSVAERAFDQTLLAILRAQGFERVHLTHGQREFGKDAIGQRNDEQWAWQSKAGDVTQSGWRNLVGQLDELRLSDLGHGAFDTGLPRKAVLVITGRLTGNAPDLFRDYNERAKKRAEPELELWDLEILTGHLADSPNAVLRGSVDGQLLTALGSADSGSATIRSIEHFSRRWTTWEPERVAGLGVIEAAVLCEHLAANQRLDLSCQLALCLVRGATAANAHPEVCDGAGVLFEAYASQMLDEYGDQFLSEDFVENNGPSAWISYPVRCTRIAEIVGLLALRVRDNEKAVEIATWLARFLGAQPGAAHPISDTYAVGLIPSVLAVSMVDGNSAAGLLHRTMVWLGDAYERERLGLGSVDASPSEEVNRLLGGPLDWVRCERRRDSVIATVLLDLSAALGFEQVYANIRNDIEAVGIYPRVLRLTDGPDQFDRTGLENRLDPNVDFSEDLSEAITAPHHADQAGRALCDDGRAWDLLAVSSAVRDRHYYCAIETFAGVER